MNEADTRAELIEPQLKASGWGMVEGSRILRERNAQITAGRIQTGGVRAKPLIADFILEHSGGSGVIHRGHYHHRTGIGPLSDK